MLRTPPPSPLRRRALRRWRRLLNRRSRCQDHLTQNLAHFTLLGPPELRHQTPSGGGGGDPFLNLMDANFNNYQPPPPPMGRPENFFPTLVSSGEPNLDFFFQVIPSTHPSTVVDLLTKSWAHLMALKLVCNLRGVRWTGKSDREVFYASALWMHDRHPQDAGPQRRVGYMKDLLEILFRLIHRPDNKVRAKLRPKRGWHYRPYQGEKKIVEKKGSREEDRGRDGEVEGCDGEDGRAQIGKEGGFRNEGGREV